VAWVFAAAKSNTKKKGARNESPGNSKNILHNIGHSAFDWNAPDGVYFGGGTDPREICETPGRTQSYDGNSSGDCKFAIALD
jgi:hypothetical protein